MSTDIPSTSMQISPNLDRYNRIYLLDLISDRPTKIRILLWFSASASMPPMFTTRENLSEFAGSLSFLSLCLQNNVCTWHTSVDRCSSRVLLLHFLPLFAQRLRAIIGTNTRCITHIWAHTLKHKRQVHVSARRRLPLMYTHARAPACKHTIASFSLTLRPLCVFFFYFSGVLRPLTAGSISERCDSPGKVQENKSVSAAASCETAFHSLPPSSVHLSDFPPKAGLRLVVSKHKTFRNQLRSDNKSKPGTHSLPPTQRPPFTNLNWHVFITVFPVRRAKLLLIIETQYNRGHAACSRCVVNQSRAAGGGRPDCMAFTPAHCSVAGGARSAKRPTLWDSFRGCTTSRIRQGLRGEGSGG